MFPIEPHSAAANNKLNWLRAAVLGANDGIVSVASIIVGVAAASNAPGFILTAGIAGLTAGALSMAVGEYVSVSTQRDTERVLLQKERKELATQPKQELEELALLYEAKGLSKGTAHLVAKELTAHDAFAAHVEAELHIDPAQLTNPWHAAYASASSFVVGGLVPLIAVVLAPATVRIETTVIAVLVALVATGVLSAYAAGANAATSTLRVVAGGLIAMAITFGIGRAFGTVGL